MTDIVDRLRELTAGDIGDDGLDAIDEAAAEIERLRAELAEATQLYLETAADHDRQLERATAAEQRVAELEEDKRNRDRIASLEAQLAEAVAIVERKEYALLKQIDRAERAESALAASESRAAGLAAAINNAKDYINCFPGCPARQGGRCECQQEEASNILSDALDQGGQR